MIGEGVSLKERIEVGLSNPALDMPPRLRCPALHLVGLVTLSVTTETRGATFPCYPCLDCGVVYRSSECSPHGVAEL